NFYRWLLSSNDALPHRSPIPLPVTAPLRTATGGGLYARVFGVSRLFFKKIFSSNSLVFSAIPPHAESSSTTDFHRWKFHRRFVEKRARDFFFTEKEISHRTTEATARLNVHQTLVVGIRRSWSASDARGRPLPPQK